MLLKRNALSLFILILCLTLTKAFIFRQLLVTAASYVTNVTTSYTILYERYRTNTLGPTTWSAAPLGPSATVTLTFPNEFTISSSITCRYSINSTGIFTSNACTVSGNVVTLSNLFTSDLVYTLSLVIGNVVNPYPAGQTSRFFGTIGVDTSNTTGTNSLVTITPALAACSFTFNPNFVYTNPTNMVVTITTVNQFPATGYINIQFPFNRRWSQDLDSTRLMPIVDGSMSCSSQSANVNSGVQCTGTLSSALVRISNAVTSTLAATQTISFSINNFNSPPTNQPVDGITITTFTSSGSTIDSCTAYVTGLLPKVIDSSSFSISESSGSDMVVNKQYTITFDITIADIISSTDYVTIVFPAGTTISNFPAATIGATLGINTATSTYSSQTLTVYFQGSITIPASSQIFITISNFVAPPSTQTTGNFVFTFLSSGGYPKMVSYQTITAVTGALSGSVAPTVSTVNLVTSYDFSITIADPITSSGSFKITFPSILTIANSTSCASIAGTNFASSPVCNFNSIENSITFTNINSSNSNIPKQTFTIKVSGITNPPSTKPTPSFSVVTYYSSTGASVDAGTISGVTAVTATIDFTKASVSASSRVNSATAVTYYLSFTVNNPIPAGGYIVVYFPTAITFDTTAASSQCSIIINSGSATSTSCTATLSTTYIFNFTNPLSSSAGINTNLTLVIGGAATNPASTRPFSPFSIFTYHSDTFPIASMQNALSYSTNAPSSFSYNQVTRVSTTNAAFTTYTITLIQPADLEVNARILVTFPANAVPQSNSTCSMTYNSATQIVGCTLSSSTFTVTSISSIIAAGTTFSISFTNIRNPLSFTALSGFSVATKSANSLYDYSTGTSSSSLQNTVATSFSNISYTYSPRQLNQPIDLELTFQLSQYTLLPSYILLSIDTYFVEGTLSCGSFINFIGSCLNISTNTVKITGTFNNSVMGLTLSGFSSQSTPPTGTTYTTLASFDATDGKIDQSLTDIIFTLQCSMPCRTCSSSNSSACLSCYSSINITTSIYFHSSSFGCYSTCPATTYNSVPTLTCQPCSSNCLTCSGSASFCTSCNSSSSFPYLNVTNSTIQICVATCDAGMYPQTSTSPAQCTSCVSPCATCTSATICITCRSGFYLQGNNTCASTCPANTSIANNSTNKCDSCDPICLTCSGTTATCTSCSTPNVYYNGACQSSCPSGGTLAPFNGICTPCVDSCLFCSETISNCTACNISSDFPYFVNNSCLSTCPQKYYNVSVTGQCLSCALAGINCVNCSSASTCLSCDTGFVFHNSQCLSYTPTGFVNISGVAVACAGDCKTCSITTTNCTSCKTLNLQGNACVSNCTVGTIPITQICTACTSPCATCSIALTNCTSCLGGLSPQKYLTANTCQQTCPNFTYPNSSTLTCANCVSPCSLCTAFASCLSCASGFFLEGTNCVTNCSIGFTGVAGLCQACTNNCRTCSGATNYCLTCNNGTYFLNATNSCVTTCNPGLFIDYSAQACVGCTSPCNTCTNTSTTCTSCTTGYLLIKECVPSCPTDMFVLSGVCTSCSNNCSSCTSVTNCTLCSGLTYLFNGACIASCPNTAPVIIAGACTACSTQNCYSCSPSDVCQVCKSPYLYLNAQCLLQCPTNYNSNGTHCIYLNQTIIDSVTAPSTFPVPFSIAGVVLVIACLMSRLQFSQTYLSGAVYSFLGLLELLALIYFLYLYYKDYYSAQGVPLWIGLGSLAYLYVLNIVGTIAQCVFLCYQKQFIAWKDASRFHKCFYAFINVISLCFSHKIRNLLFCKLFTFKIFSAKLDKVQHFRIFNIFSLLSLAHSGGAIFSAAVAMNYINHQQQIYYQAVDVIVLTSVNVLLAFFNTHKEKDFFEEVTPQGFSLHKKNRLDEDHFPDKIKVQGHDGQIEEGFLNDYSHALQSKAALRFDEGSLNDLYSASLEGVSEKQLEGSEQSEPKQYEQISVQAYDLIEEKANVTAKTLKSSIKPKLESISIQADQIIQGQKNDKGIDLSDLPYQGFQNESSNFTKYGYFQKVDKSAQSNLDRGVNHSVQITLDQVDMSVQKYQDGIAVDCSVQKDLTRGNDISIQKTSLSRHDVSIQPSEKLHDRSVAMSYRPTSDKPISAKPSMRSQQNQFIIEQQDQQLQIQPENMDYGIQPTIDYKDIAIQPTLQVQEEQPELNSMGIQYEPQEEFAYNQFQEQLQNEHTPSNIVFDDNEEIDQEQPQKQLAEERAEQLQMKIDNVRSYQEELEERVRDREKQLQELKRKIMMKERMNQQKREAIEKINTESERVELGGIRVNQQRPKVSSTVEQPKIVGKISFKPKINEVAQVGQLGIESKQLPKQSISEGESRRQKTIQQINPNSFQAAVSIPADDSQAVRQKTIEEIEVKRQQHTVQARQPSKQSEPEAFGEPLQEIYQQKRIQYNQVDKSLSSHQNESNVFVRSKTHNEIPPITSQQTRKHQIEYQPLSDYQLKSSGTKKNLVSSQKKEYRVNIQEIDRSLGNDEEQIEDQLEEVNSDYEPTGILHRFAENRPKVRDPSPESDMSGTIEEIPRHYSKVDNDKTISNSSAKGQKNQKEKMPSKMNRQQVTNYYKGQLSAAALATKHKEIPKDSEVDRFHINKLYQRQVEKEQPIPKGNNQARNNTFALAGRAQFTEDIAKRKGKETKNPLETQKRWQYRNEEQNNFEDQFRNVPVSNRANLARNKQLQNFASHLVLPQESDKQETSFQKALHKQEKEDKPVSEKKKIELPRSKKQAEEIQVHFEAEQFSQDMSMRGANDAPQIPRAGYSRKVTSQASHSLYNQQSEEVDYRGMILLDHMQERPNNDDLQQYYQRKASKDNRKRSNSKVDRSTEKIYLQRMDRRRK